MNPLIIFEKWFNQELERSKVRIPTAVCLSTNGIDGFPNARMVSFKEIANNSFVITGTLSSRKGIEIENNNKVALTFWWAITEKQVRIQGKASKISDDLADNYFLERNRDSQMVSLISEQGQEIESLDTLIKKYKHIKSTYVDKPVKRPKNWSGYLINPIRIEFLEFKEIRLHNRVLFEYKNDVWKSKQIQP